MQAWLLSVSVTNVYIVSLQFIDSFFLSNSNSLIQRFALCSSAIYRVQSLRPNMHVKALITPARVFTVLLKCQ